KSCWPPAAGRPAARNLSRAPRAPEPHFEHDGFDDGADIETIALRDNGMRDAPAAILALPDAGEALVGFERIAAGGDEIDHGVEIGAGQLRVGSGGCDPAGGFIRGERGRARAAKDKRAPHTEGAGPP